MGRRKARWIARLVELRKMRGRTKGCRVHGDIVVEPDFRKAKTRRLGCGSVNGETEADRNGTVGREGGNRGDRDLNVFPWIVHRLIEERGIVCDIDG